MYHPAGMETLGILVVVLVVLATSVAAVRRDPRFDRREILVQLGWIVLYFAGCAGLAFVLVPLGRRIGPSAATAIGVTIIVVGMVALARHLKQRLEVRRRL